MIRRATKMVITSTEVSSIDVPGMCCSQIENDKGGPVWRTTGELFRHISLDDAAGCLSDDSPARGMLKSRRRSATIPYAPRESPTTQKTRAH
jgi:hypothetical protein